MGSVTIRHVAEEAGHSLDAVFDVARDVARRGVRAHHREHVGEALDPAHRDTSSGSL